MSSYRATGSTSCPWVVTKGCAFSPHRLSSWSSAEPDSLASSTFVRSSSNSSPAGAHSSVAIALGSRGQILLPGRRDAGGRDLDEDVRPRRLRCLLGVHVDLLGQAVALAAVAGGAGGDDVLPDRLAAPTAGDDVVDREAGLAGAAVLAGPGVAGEDGAAGDLAPVRFARDAHVVDEADHVRPLHRHVLGMDRPLAPLEQLRLFLQEQHGSPSQRANVDRLIRCVEYEYSCHAAGEFYAGPASAALFDGIAAQNPDRCSLRL